MSFRKPHKEEFAPKSNAQNEPCSAQGKLCFAMAKQDIEKLAELEEVKEESSNPAGVEFFLDGEVKKNSEAEDSEILEDARVEPLARTAPVCPALTKQSANRALMGRPTREESTYGDDADSFIQTPELLKLHPIELNEPPFEDYDSDISPLCMTNGVRGGCLTSSNIVPESNSENTVETFQKTPGSCSEGWIALNTLNFQDQNGARMPLKMQKQEAHFCELVGAVEKDSSKTGNVVKFVKSLGFFRAKKLGMKESELNFPNFASGSPAFGFCSPDSGKFKFPGGGKFVYSNWRRVWKNRRLGTDGIASWDPGKSISSGELARSGLEAKRPILEVSPESINSPETGKIWSAFLNVQNPIVCPDFAYFCVEGESWSTTKELEQIGDDSEGANFL
ncbi:unnamed protein product [Linum trigynum]|uniref:Uncharacterized protein n=1 Tax=Linum trigynum TaxID=586398 RepID=A0AAV2GN19_9ROSI